MMADKIRSLVFCGLLLPAVAMAIVGGDNDHDNKQLKAKVQAQAKAQLAMRKAHSDMRKAGQELRMALANAEQILAKSMLASRDINVIAIVIKGGECVQKLKVEQKAKGGQLSTVLQPLSMQNVTLFSKGNKSFTYWPDQRLVVECDGEIEGLEDIAERAALAGQNYDLRFMTTAPDIAGRTTFCVIAEPKAPGVPARQFFIDQQTLYPLRFTTETEGGWRVAMDTQVVNFPKSMPQVNFSPVGTPRKFKFDPAQPLSKVPNAKDRLGFEPVIPKHLPYGFTVQRSELRRNQDGQLAMLWLTDGLATARVYEFRSNQLRDGIWSQGTNTVLTEDGITMVLDADLKADVRKNLLRAFAKRRPTEVDPPSIRTASLGVKPPPIPNEEPRNPKSLFKLEEVEPAVISASSATASSSSVSSSPENNVKGE
jgi:hypothetical protein